MTKQEFLAMSLPYNRLILVKQGAHSPNGYLERMNDLTWSKYSNSNIDLPIIRHISTLTEPVTHKGETFVPTERLMWDDSYVEVYHKNEINVNEASFSDVLKLIEWGYWPDMPEDEEVVYVTDEFNPYK